MSKLIEGETPKTIGELIDSTDLKGFIESGEYNKPLPVSVEIREIKNLFIWGMSCEDISNLTKFDQIIIELICAKSKGDRLDRLSQDVGTLLCISAAKLCKNELEFSQKYPSRHLLAAEMGWTEDICEHMEKYTLEYCHECALKCNCPKEFKIEFPEQYYICEKNTWINIVCGHMRITAQNNNWRTSTSFARDCEKNKGLGILYMIRMFNDSEDFYKVGITSQSSLYLRYASRSDSHGYDFEPIWTLTLAGYDVHRLESQYIKETRSLAYQPSNWPGRSTETFKCSKDHEILEYPEHRILALAKRGSVNRVLGIK